MKEEGNNIQNENNLIEETESKVTEENSQDNKDNEEVVNWKEQCIQGNLMPAVLLLDEGKISVNDIVNPENGNTILHYAANFGFYNVIRALIEKFGADVNIQNKLGYTPFYYIVSTTDINFFNFHYFIKT